jgi:hypothetical protein
MLAWQVLAQAVPAEASGLLCHGKALPLALCNPVVEGNMDTCTLQNVTQKHVLSKIT